MLDVMLAGYSAFAHLSADRAVLYRAILDTFVKAKRRFALHLRPADVERALAETDLGLTEQPVGDALAQLVEWGNLEAHPDTADVATVEEFYRPRHLYQLTPAGEAVERALEVFDAGVRAKGELQAVALGDIRLLLDELLALAIADPLDEGKAHLTLLTLRGRFDELTAKAQAFMSSLQRTIDLHGLSVDALVAYKQSLIDYLERFIGELMLATAEIAERLQALDDQGVERLLAAAARRELADALDPTPAERERAEAIWKERWQGLRAWFVASGDGPSQAEILRQRGRSSIPALLMAVARINDRRVARSDRSADLRALALWFAEVETDEEAHRLWRAAFALSPARHLAIDEESLAAREAAPVTAQTGWLEAPPIGISPRLRESGRYTRPGPAARVVDRTAEKTALARLLDLEAAQFEAARRRLASGRRLRLSELAALGRAEFDLLLDLLGEAIGARPGPDGVIETSSTDGSLLIRLEPPASSEEQACLETEAGRLWAPDFIVRITDAFSDAQVADQ